ncbi:MAG: AAA family ATPase [Phycisphaerales bacterium JB038]
MKFGTNLNAVRSAILSHAKSPEDVRREVAARAPVITISREAGANAPAIVESLMHLLNQRQPHAPWSLYDSELVQRVAEDHDLAEHLVHAVEERDRSWIERFAAGLTGTPTDVEVAMKVAKTIRGVAAVGHAVIVGRGGQAILRGLKHTTHVRLIAPEDWRAEQYAREAGLDAGKALAEVRRIDGERRRFVKHHFHQDPDDHWLYHLTLDVARVKPERAAAAIAALVD